MATGLDDHIDGVLDVLDHVGIGHRDFCLEGRDRETLHGQLRGFGMERGHGAAMAGVDGFQKGHGLLAAHLAQDDPVGAHAQRRGEQHIGGLEFRVAIGDEGHGIWLGRQQLGGFFDGHDAFLGSHVREDLARSHGLAGGGAARDDHVELVLDAEGQRIVDHARGHHRAQGTLLFHAQVFELAFFAIEKIERNALEWQA